MQQQRQLKRMVLEVSPLGKQLNGDWQTMAVAILSEGRQVVQGEDIQFFVDNVAYGGIATTDGMGRASLQIVIPANHRSARISAQVVGEATSASQQVYMPQEQPLQISLETSPLQKVGDQWQTVAVVYVSRENQPMVGVLVRLAVNFAAQGAAWPTDNNGRMQEVLNFQTAAGAVNISAEVVNSTARANLVVEIPKAVKVIPTRLEIKADGSHGLYTVHVFVVDENGRGVKSKLRFYSLRGVVNPTQPNPNGGFITYNDYEDRETDDNGALAFPVQFEDKETQIGVIVLGTVLDQKVVLEGPRGLRLAPLAPNQQNMSLWDKIKFSWIEAGRQKRDRRGRR